MEQERVRALTLDAQHREPMRLIPIEQWIEQNGITEENADENEVSTACISSSVTHLIGSLIDSSLDPLRLI